MIRVTYPNEGLYSAGQPRWEQVDKAGNITSCREATAQEAMAYSLMDLVEGLSYQISALQQELRNRQ